MLLFCLNRFYILVIQNMARVSKLTRSIGGMHIRRKIWAREVRRGLLKGKLENASLAHEIDDAIKNAISKLTLESKNELNKIFHLSSEVYISRTSWHCWWHGKQHPTLNKINLINFIFSESEDWYNSTLPILKNESFKTFLFAIDIWSSKFQKKVDAFRILSWVGDKWGPQCIIEGEFPSQRYIGWAIPKLKVETNAEIAQKYKVLEPPSIMEMMLYAGLQHSINDSEHFLDWILDLISACLATTAILHEYDDSQTDVAGSSADVMGCIFNIFISKPDQYIDLNKSIELIKEIQPSSYRSLVVRIQSLNKTKSFHFNEDKLPLILYFALHKYFELLSKYEITTKDIYSLDPRMWWNEHAAKVVISKNTIW